jgi:hypothetical protein
MKFPRGADWRFVIPRSDCILHTIYWGECMSQQQGKRPSLDLLSHDRKDDLLEELERLTSESRKLIREHNRVTEEYSRVHQELEQIRQHRQTIN